MASHDHLIRYGVLTLSPLVPGLSGGIAKPKLNLKSSSKGKPSGVVYYMVDSIEKVISS